MPRKNYGKPSQEKLRRKGKVKPLPPEAVDAPAEAADPDSTPDAREHPVMETHPGDREKDPVTGQKPKPVRKPRARKPKPAPEPESPQTPETPDVEA